MSTLTEHQDATTGNDITAKADNAAHKSNATRNCDAQHNDVNVQHSPPDLHQQGPGQQPPQQVATTASNTPDPPSPAAVSTAQSPEEYIDPNEPRYCVCGDVS